MCCYGDVIDCVFIVQMQFISEILRTRAQSQADGLLFTHLDAKVTTNIPSCLVRMYSVTCTHIHAHMSVLCMYDHVRVCVLTCICVCTILPHYCNHLCFRVM